MMKYSQSTGCFYPEWGKYDNIPSDAIDATEEEFESVITSKPGSIISVVDGKINIVSSSQNERYIIESQVLNEADDETSKIIEKGFVYDGKNIRLTVEDQKNILVLWLTRDLQTYPRTIKIWNNGLAPVLYTFNNSTELNQFFLAGVAHIDNAIMTGVQIKASVANKTTEELKVWKDPRKG